MVILVCSRSPLIGNVQALIIPRVSSHIFALVCQVSLGILDTFKV